MSFQENTKKEKYKLPLLGHFTFHAFHPKAVNEIPFFKRGVRGRSSGLGL